MAPRKYSAWLGMLFLILFCVKSDAKLTESDISGAGHLEKPVKDRDLPELKAPKKVMSDGAALLFADELKVTMERYLFGICPQTFKMQLGRTKNASITCDLDVEQQDLAGRFATLALRAHSAARSDCSRLGAALVNTLGDLARAAAGRHDVNVAAATAEANKKRKLSKSQKAKIQAKQRTALAVKKKAAAVAAAAAAKMTGAAS